MRQATEASAAAASGAASRSGSAIAGDAHVTATGDYGRDCKIGRALALEYLAMEEANPDGPGDLPKIVNDMPRPITGVEIGFFTFVAYAAGAGAHRAREIAAYWDEQSALRARHDVG
jgi:hypothetical protein